MNKAAAPHRGVIALRVLLTALTVFFLYRGTRFYQMSLEPPGAEYVFPGGDPFYADEQAVQSEPHLDFPWPKYPGADVLHVYRLDFKPQPLLEQVLRIFASRERILRFYRRQLNARGFQDITESLINFDPLALDWAGHPLSLHNEQLMRSFDAFRQGIMCLQKGDEYISVRIDPGPKRGQHDVQLTAFNETLADQFAAQFEEEAWESGSEILTYPNLETAHQYGGEQYATRIYHSSLGVEGMFAEMRRKLEVEGWSQRRYNPGEKSINVEGTAVGYFTRGKNGKLLLVSPSGDEGHTQGSITTFSEPP